MLDSKRTPFNGNDIMDRTTFSNERQVLNNIKNVMFSSLTAKFPKVVLIFVYQHNIVLKMCFFYKGIA